MTKKNRRKRRKSYICNFRAPNEKLYREWKEYVKFVKEELHSDVCYVTLSQIRAFRKSFREATQQAQIRTPFTIININQQNTFHYIVSRARRKTPIEGIDLCVCPGCHEVATHELVFKNGKARKLCKQHTEEYRKHSIAIKTIQHSKTFV